MDARTQEILKKFEDSWNETEAFYNDLLNNNNGFAFIKPILEFIKYLRDSGEWVHYRIGTSVHTLVLSRSVEHALRGDQKEVRIERVKDLPSGFEYNVCICQNGKTYREYRVTDLRDIRLMKLLNTLKRTLID